MSGQRKSSCGNPNHDELGRFCSADKAKGKSGERNYEVRQRAIENGDYDKASAKDLRLLTKRAIESPNGGKQKDWEIRPSGYDKHYEAYHNGEPAFGVIDGEVEVYQEKYRAYAEDFSAASGYPMQADSEVGRKLSLVENENQVKQLESMGFTAGDDEWTSEYTELSYIGGGTWVVSDNEAGKVYQMGSFREATALAQSLNSNYEKKARARSKVEDEVKEGLKSGKLPHYQDDEKTAIKHRVLNEELKDQDAEGRSREVFKLDGETYTECIRKVDGNGNFYYEAKASDGSVRTINSERYEKRQADYEAEAAKVESMQDFGSLAARVTVNKVKEKEANRLIAEAKANMIRAQKKKQFEAIQKANPMKDNYHTGIRSASDIKTFDEAMTESPAPDFTDTDIANAMTLKKVTVFSSKPIEVGSFVTPSRMEAESYAGGKKVYSKEVDIASVAWIDNMEGQYAGEL